MADRRLRIPLLLSIAAALATIALKFGAYWITDSVSLLSDAVESLINLVAAATAFFSILYAAKPVDADHTYGHQKIEYFSSGLEGALIIVAAGGIALQAVHRLFHQEPLAQLDLGALLSTVAALVNLAIAQLLLRVGRAHGSIVLEADGQHLMTDVYTSAGVLVGLGAVWLTGLTWIDPLVALAMAANITWTGIDLVRRSFDGLMDHALPREEQERVRAAIEAQLGPGMDYHAVRTRRAGSRRFADFHLLVPGGMTVRAAHGIAERMEEAIRAALPGIEMTVHIEPIEERGSWEDSALVALEQEERRQRAAEKLP